MGLSVYAGRLPPRRKQPERRHRSPSVSQTSTLFCTRVMTLSVNSVVVEPPPRSEVRMPVVDGLKGRFVDGAGGAGGGGSMQEG